jgi:hypothetical protein
MSPISSLLLIGHALGEVTLRPAARSSMRRDQQFQAFVDHAAPEHHGHQQQRPPARPIARPMPDAPAQGVRPLRCTVHWRYWPCIWAAAAWADCHVAHAWRPRCRRPRPCRLSPTSWSPLAIRAAKPLIERLPGPASTVAVDTPMRTLPISTPLGLIGAST